MFFGHSLHKALEEHHFSKNPIRVFDEAFDYKKLSKEELPKFGELREAGHHLINSYLEQESYLKDTLKIRIDQTETELSAENVIDPITKKKLLFDKVTGRIDFITKDGRIGDYKTASKKYTEESINESLQPDMYYLLYYLKYHKLPKSFIYIVFLKKRKREPIQILETTRTMEHLSELIKKLNIVYLKVEQKQFERSHGPDTFCDCYQYEELLKI